MSPDPYWERTRNNPSLRRDARYVAARQADSGVAGAFWGAMLALCVLFWPSYALHGETRAVVSLIWYGAVFAAVTWIAIAVTVSQSRKQRPPGGTLQVEAPARVPAPPICLHLNAVKVDNAYYRSLGRTVILHCWCPDCDPDGKDLLPANFRRLCCGSEPEAPHMYNCPHAAAR